jgi:uncharacterized protein (DUF39 family)
VAFERPASKGYRNKEVAINKAEKHIKTQFTRIGVNSEDVKFEHTEK